MAALAALIALMASAPYIALQLKAITQTILMVVDSFEHGRLTPGAPSSTFYLAVTLLLAAFAMAFGTRRIDPTEHQDGLILAIAVESIVKLVAFLAVGAFVVWGLFGGLGELTRVAETDARIGAVIQSAARSRQLADHDAALGVGDPAAAAPVPRQRRRESQSRATSSPRPGCFPSISC